VSGQHGHATPLERAAVLAAEERAGRVGDVRSWLDLAQLYIEPEHREEEANTIFRYVLSSDSMNVHAVMGMAFLAIHSVMTEEFLREAVALLEGVLDLPGASGGIGLLLAEALDDLGGLSSADRVALLERSVQADPGWVTNRRWLAREYMLAGRLSDSLRQMDSALGNLLSDPDELSTLEESYHMCFTGKTESRIQLLADREALLSNDSPR
jgi:hypothetical protein